MRRLAIDTSTLACTVALQVDGVLIERHEEKAREHTRLLMPMIRDVLTEADTELAALDAIVLGNGPGSFIGLRIAASVAQGLAFGAGLNIIPVSSLAAVAAQVFNGGEARTVAVAQDAHMHEIYLGLYARGPNGLPQAVCDERLHAVGAISELKGHDTCAVAGEGWLRYPEHLEANVALRGAHPDVLYPRAAWLLALSDNCPEIEPDKLVPAYLRQKVAQKPQ